MKLGKPNIKRIKNESFHIYIKIHLCKIGVEENICNY